MAGDKCYNDASTKIVDVRCNASGGVRTEGKVLCNDKCVYYSDVGPSPVVMDFSELPSDLSQEGLAPIEQFTNNNHDLTDSKCHLTQATCKTDNK